MTDALFPNRARRIGSSDYGMDADHFDHHQREPGYPELEVVDDEPIGVIWHPNGEYFREVWDREPVRFGFHQEPKA